MCLRCASVSLTLLAVTGAVLLSTLEVQLLKVRIAATATSALFAMITRDEILTVPPTAAQSLKQCRRIGVAARLGLYQIDARLLIGLFSAEQGEVTRVAVLPLSLSDVQRGFGGIRCRGGSFEPCGILVERGQSIGNVLAGCQDRTAILLGGL